MRSVMAGLVLLPMLMACGPKSVVQREGYGQDVQSPEWTKAASDQRPKEVTKLAQKKTTNR
ncbi:MAG: hypothetical protein EOP09_07175 [Proteobacteria bacterium]|nr:MAG: hypothetical protein EOP09_07175 [Pseudomonadota bacterium]